MSEKEKISFSYSDETKKKLEKMAKAYDMPLMGYVRFILKKEAKKLRGTN